MYGVSTSGCSLDHICISQAERESELKAKRDERYQRQADERKLRQAERYGPKGQGHGPWAMGLTRGRRSSLPLGWQGLLGLCSLGCWLCHALGVSC